MRLVLAGVLILFFGGFVSASDEGRCGEALSDFVTCVNALKNEDIVWGNISECVEEADYVDSYGELRDCATTLEDWDYAGVETVVFNLEQTLSDKENLITSLQADKDRLQHDVNVWQSSAELCQDRYSAIAEEIKKIPHTEKEYRICLNNSARLMAELGAMEGVSAKYRLEVEGLESELDHQATVDAYGCSDEEFWMIYHNYGGAVIGLDDASFDCLKKVSAAGGSYTSAWDMRRVGCDIYATANYISLSEFNSLVGSGFMEHAGVVETEGLELKVYVPKRFSVGCLDVVREVGLHEERRVQDVVIVLCLVFGGFVVLEHVVYLFFRQGIWRFIEPRLPISVRRWF